MYDLALGQGAFPMSDAIGRPAAAATFLQARFFFVMSLVIAAVVVYGFSHTINANLIHPVQPAVARPLLLWVHGATFGSWVALFVAQTGLVATRNVHLHKRLGLFGLVLGAAVIVVGVSTTIVMMRFRALNPSPGDDAAFASVPLNDITAFTVLFATGAALRWRNREAHRRLMYMATCVLTAAAWGRFPTSILPDGWFYAGVDALVLIGVARDLVVMRRVHAVYLYGLPVIVAGQAAALALIATRPTWWLAAVHAVVG